MRLSEPAFNLRAILLQPGLQSKELPATQRRVYVLRRPEDMGLTKSIATPNALRLHARSAQTA
jgi:hypothetical protein